MSRLHGENFDQSYFIFLSYCHLQILALETCIKDEKICKNYSSFKHILFELMLYKQNIFFQSQQKQCVS